MATLAIIGGTGLSQMDGLKRSRREMIKTPYGAPSCPIIFGELDGQSVAFLTRHGSTHVIPPHRINYCANIWALHSVGVKRIIAVGAVGGIDDSCTTGAIVIPDQIIDYTFGRENTFFNGAPDPVKNIEFSLPYDESLRRALINGASGVSDVTLVNHGTYGVMQGPRLETAAEIRRMAQDGCSIVGMTGMPEAALARELDMAYACCAVVVNPAAGKNAEPLQLQSLPNVIETGMLAASQVISQAIGCLE